MRRAIWPLGFPVIIIGGIYGGIFTPTEASIVAVFYALFVSCFVYRELDLYGVYGVLRRGRDVGLFLLGRRKIE